MANFLYNKARERLLKGEINWLTNDIRIVLVNSSYSPTTESAHSILSDIPNSAIVVTSDVLTGKSVTNGVVIANDITISSVPITPQVTGMIIIKANATLSTSPLLAFIDTAGGLDQNLPPNQNQIKIQWAREVGSPPGTTSGRIFKL